MGLHTKIAEVMGSVDRIPKNGYNDFHRYHYATEADVSDAIRSELANRGVALYVSSEVTSVREWRTPKDKPTLITDVLVTLTFADGESGETFSITAAGTGDDASDKGTYKAITGAVKYALMKTFLVPTGDDPEASNPSEQAQDQPKRAAKKPAAKDKGVEAVATTFNAQVVDADVDLDYRFTWGKHTGKHLKDVEGTYLDWLLKQPAKKGYEEKHAVDCARWRAELARRGAAA